MKKKKNNTLLLNNKTHIPLLMLTKKKKDVVKTDSDLVKAEVSQCWKHVVNTC